MEWFSVYLLSRLHAGEGTDVGFIDLPIQRERHTGYPVVRASGIKGVLRDFCQSSNDCKKEEEKWFGSSPGDGHDQTKAGALTFSDAYILAFPVRGFRYAPFWWITSPNVLRRFVEITERQLNCTLPMINEETVYVNNNFNEIYLEGIKVKTTKIDCVDGIAKIIKPGLLKYTADDLEKRLVIVSDALFSLMVRNSTEILARIVINDKTHTADNLWYEEFLPMDTIMYFTVRDRTGRREDKHFAKFLGKGRKLFLGGDITVGSGLVYVSWVKGGDGK